MNGGDRLLTRAARKERHQEHADGREEEKERQYHPPARFWLLVPRNSHQLS